MRYGELKKLLKESGCRKVSEGAKHEKWESPKTNRAFRVGRHNAQEVPAGTLNSILKDAGIK